MILQDIKSRLNETRNWYIVLTLPRKERKTKGTLENKGMITYLPTIYVKRRWKEQVKEIQIPAVNRCVFIYATGTELEGLKGIYPTLPIEMTEVGGSRNLVGIIVSYSHPKFRPLPHGNKSIGGVGSHRASL